jgi:hypothetical protein
MDSDGKRRLSLHLAELGLPAVGLDQHHPTAPDGLLKVPSENHALVELPRIENNYPATGM